MMHLPLNPLEALEDLAGLTSGDGNDDVFELAIGPYVNGQLRVLEFEGSEAVNDLYTYEVTFTSHLPLAGLYALAGEPGCLTVKATDDNEPRVIQGIVAALEALGAAPGERGTGRRRYRATLVPKLWLLTQRRTIRHFQQKTPKEILEQVLADIKIAPKECNWHIRERDYPKLPFVYQRDETDYEFFRRVASDAGIVWCFEHASGLLDTMVPGAGAVAGALGSVADMIGGPVASAVEGAGAMTKMLTALTFSDDARHLPAVQNMALANELLGSALQSGVTALAKEIGGKALGDAAGGLIENPADDIPYDDEGGAGTDEERIFDFGLKKTMRPKTMRAIDRDAGSGNWASVAKKGPVSLLPNLGLGLAIGPKGPSLKGHAGLDLDVDAPTVPPSMMLQQIYQLDPNLRHYADKQQRVNIELDRTRVDRIQGTGHSDCRRLGAGYRFRLEGHPNGDLDREYTVTAVVSRGVTDPASNEQRVYQNEFRCIPSSILPLPERGPRPRLSPEYARVVAVHGKRVTSNLDTNSYGHVHIRFDWDVPDDEDVPRRDLAYGAEHDDAVWVPVSQPWGGDGYGMQCLPREGMEVIVGFLEGHSERPYIKGCVYGDDNQLPFPRKIDHQKIGLRSRSIPEDGNWSEFSIDDQRQSELMSLRAARNLDVHVLHDARTHIEGDAAEHVEGNRNVHVDKDLGTSIGGVERHVVAGNRIEGVAGTVSATIGGSEERKIDGSLTETIGASCDQIVMGATQVAVRGGRTTKIGNDDVITIGEQSIVTIGDKETPGKSSMSVVNGSYRRRAKTITFEADELLILRSGKTELRLTPEALTFLSKAIHGSAKELKLRGDGPTLRLDTKAELFSTEINLHGKEVKLHISETMNLETAKGVNESSGVKTVTAELESRYALELFEKVAEGLPANVFAARAMIVFGSDIPPESYLALHRDLVAKAVKNPPIVLASKGNIGGELGQYNNKTREIHISTELPLSAKTNESDAGRLFLVLLHEFGHHVDNLLRRDYTQPPNDGDAPGEEGAVFAYSIAAMDHHEKGHVQLGVYTRDGQSVPLKLEYGKFHQAVKEYHAKQQNEEGGKTKEVEGFGDGKQGEERDSHGKAKRQGFFGHGSIEDQGLSQADSNFFSNGEKITKKYTNGTTEEVTTDRKRDMIYFGNWLRDNSQICVRGPMEAINTIATIQSFGTAEKMVGRNLLTAYAKAKAANHFRRGLEFAPWADVTKANLGVYRPEDHIDNPKGMADDSSFDPDLRGQVKAEEYQVDKTDGLKNYIKNDGGSWATSAEFIRKNLEAAATASVPDRYRFFGEALHPLEDLYAHSNFIELTLLRLQREKLLDPSLPPVFPWVGRNSEVLVSRTQPNGLRYTDLRLPMVTGMFGMEDTVISLMEIALEMLGMPPTSWKTMARSAFELSSPFAFGLATAQAAIHDPRTKDGIALESALEQVLGRSAKVTLMGNRAILAAAATSLISQMGRQEGDYIKDMRDPNGATGSDPTHSMLTKDHPEHPLHTVAAKCAIELVKRVGLAMRDVWNNGGKGVNRLVDTALSFVIHPEDVDRNGKGLAEGPAEVMKLIETFATTEREKVRRLDLEGSIRLFEKHADEERRTVARLADDALGGDESLLKGMLALFPELNPGSDSGAA